MEKRKNTVFTGAAVLAVSLVLSKLLGATYRIPLTNVLGGEGMGLYQMVFPLYTLLLTISSGGFPTAISRVVSVRLASGDEEGAKKVLKVCLAALTATGLACTLALIVLARPIAAFQGNPSAALAYVGIAPAVVAVAVTACYRGYYQGRENMLPTALSQFIEQAGKLLFGLTLSSVLVKKGVAYGVLGALTGVSLSELVTACALAIAHALKERRLAKTRVAAEFSGDITAGLESASYERRGRIGAVGILKSVLSFALPVTFGALVIPLTQVVDSVLIINVLTATGHSAESATTAYGLVSGTVNTIINMPAVVISAFSVTLLPKIARSCGNAADLEREAALGVKLCLALGIAAFLGIFTYAEDVVRLLYARGLTPYQLRLAARLLRINSLAVFYVSLVQVCTAILQGVGHPKSAAFNLALGGAVKVAVTAVTLPLFGIYGAVIGSVACYALTAVADVVSLRKRVRLRLDKSRWYVLPIASALFLIAAFAIREFVYGFTGVFLSALTALALFVAAALGLGWLDGDERRKLFPFFRGKGGKRGKNC